MRWLLCGPALLATAALAYNPPVDTAGPLTVRIHEPATGSYGAGGPVTLNRTGVPFSVVVSLENSGTTPLQGRLRLTAIDRWKVEPDTVEFTLRGHERSDREFRVTMAPVTYNALYPLHAVADAEGAGERFSAHAVMILLTQFPDPPRAAPIPWKPVGVGENRLMGLWRLAVRRETATVERQPDAAPSFQVAPAVEFGIHLSGRDAIAMRLGPRQPSRQENVTSAAVEYWLQFPKTGPIRLRFANAAAGGRTETGFRVRVDDSPVWEDLTVGKSWHDAEVDLSQFAGRTIRLKLECSGAGRGLWAEPTIVSGRPPAQTSGPVESAPPLEIAPGSRGILDATIALTLAGRRISFHGFRVRVLGDELDDARSASELIAVHREEAGGRPRLRHRFRSWAGDFDLLCEWWVEHGTARFRFWLENTPPAKPWLRVYLEEAGAGPWSAHLERVYAGLGNVIQRPGAFRLPFDGHRMATSFAGFDFAGGFALVEAVDAVPDRLEVDPQERICTLVAPHAQTITFIPAPNVWAAVKVWREMRGVAAAGGVSKLAGRFVFDLWSGRYRESADALEKAFACGLTDAVVVWHNWQRWGYDYRLPDIVPPNPQFGTPAEFAALARACAQHGVLFAPHDNYIDFYPDATGFTYADVAFEPDGSPHKAWYHWERQAQSYRFRPDRVRPFLERNLRAIRDAIAPTAYFIDVWSSMAPWDYWSSDGEFFDRQVTRSAWGESFAWIRDYLGGAPQISEAGHDQLIGWLDGAQANHLRVETPPASGFVWLIAHEDAERIPWYDMAWHDKIALHGAGYEDRYAAGLDEKAHGIYSADYRSTEVLTGHPAMVKQPFGREVVRTYWLLHDLMRALAMRRMTACEFVGGNLHRQHVTWEGGEVWVNRGPDDWEAAGHVLPQYGFYAHVGPVEAAMERRGGNIAEWSRGPDGAYRDGERIAPDGKRQQLPAVNP
ncbi:MAG TPA: hypothetical protein VMI94_23115 [Bryobacteraceae bacterium]|nr:hypothetical protein [Bryobacteraceae bacterium]